MALTIRNWAPIAVGMGDSPSIWSYRGPLGDSLEDIESEGYFNGLSDDLINADFKTGDFIQVVTFNHDFALLVMVVNPQDILTARIAPQKVPYPIQGIPVNTVTSGLIPTQEQSGFLFYATDPNVEVQLGERSQLSVNTNYRFVNSSTGNFTIKPFGIDKIDGVNSDIVLAPNQAKSIANLNFEWNSIDDANFSTGGGGGTVTSVDTAQPARGITITGGPITTAGTLTFALANDLEALENITTTGFGVRSASETWITRTITGLVNNIDVKDGDGIAANPQISIHPSYIGQSSITTVGTITTGSWTGDTIAIANGGTGQTTAQLAINALTNVAAATNEFVLTKDTATGNAIWKINDGAGTVTSVDVQGGTTGLTTSGGPVTTSGTITLAGTLNIANGGTGATTQQAAINALTDTAGGTPGQLLTVSSDNNAVWQTLATGALPATQGRPTSPIALTTSFADLSLGITDVENDPAVIEINPLANDEILIKETGLYQIQYSGNADITSAGSVDAEMEIRVRLNDATVIAGSLAKGGNHYSGTGTFSEDPHVSNAFVVELTASDKVSAQGQYVLTSGTPTAINLQNFQINVTKLEGLQGPTGATGAGANIIVQKDDVTVGTTTSTLNFEGNGVSSVVDDGANKTTVTIAGPSYAHIYATSNATVTPLTQNTPAKILGTTTANVFSSDFTLTSNRITYTGSVLRLFNIQAHACLVGNSNDRQFKFFIYKNGVLFAPIQTCHDVQGTTAFSGISMSGIVSLSNTDYVEIWMENIENNDDATAVELSLTAISI